MMAISHADHDHPNTPAARAKCRKEMSVQPFDASTGTTPVSKPAQMTVVARKPRDGGVVKGMKAAEPKALKRSNSKIWTIGDLADVPKILAYGIRLAWAADLDVVVGDRYREDEKRVVIKADKGEISLVWKDKNLHGLTAIWIRNWDSSVQYKVESVQHALELGAFDSEAWDEFGNLRKPVTRQCPGPRDEETGASLSDGAQQAPFVPAAVPVEFQPRPPK